MVVNLRAKKRLVSRVTGVGIHRIRFDSDHLEDIADAITRENVRGLITANTITFKPIVGTSRGNGICYVFEMITIESDTMYTNTSNPRD